VPFRSLVVDRLSTAKRIILIGHGPGVVGISELLESRSERSNYLQLVHALSYLAAGVMRHVKLVVQVVGYTKIPLVPKKGPDLITWYQKVRTCSCTLLAVPSHLTQYQHSLVIVPHDHVIRHEGKILKRHGQLVFAGEYPVAFLSVTASDHFALSAEESKPVKLMLRALPLIQTHVRNILAPSAVLG